MVHLKKCVKYQNILWDYHGISRLPYKSMHEFQYHDVFQNHNITIIVHDCPKNDIITVN